MYGGDQRRASTGIPGRPRQTAPDEREILNLAVDPAASAGAEWRAALLEAELRTRKKPVVSGGARVQLERHQALRKRRFPGGGPAGIVL